MKCDTYFLTVRS